MSTGLTADQVVVRLRSELGRVLVGQRDLVDRLLIGLLTGGHLLLEGVPGLAKTLAARSLAAAVGAQFSRIQFTPDLLPADLLGTEVFHPGTGEFSIRKGPLVVQDPANQGLTWIENGRFHWRAAPRTKAIFDCVNAMFSPNSNPMTLLPHSPA